MSEQATKIIAIGLVDEGLKFEEMEREILRLKELISSKNPICPHCHKEMTMFEFNGYYDKLIGWTCGCETIPEGVEHEHWDGAYCN